MTPEQKMKKLIQKDLASKREELAKSKEQIIRRIVDWGYEVENPMIQTDAVNNLRHDILKCRKKLREISFLESTLGWDILNPKPIKKTAKKK